MRSIWSGSISFGLVNIPVKLFSAAPEVKGIDFDLLHKKDLSPIRYAKVCKKENKEIHYEEIVRGFEYEKNNYVVIEDDDFKKANVKKTTSIEIIDFTVEDNVDSIYYEKPYYLEPDKNSFKSYALLREALKKAGKVGVTKFVLRNREHLGIIKANKNAIILNQLRFADELREDSELSLPDSSMARDKEIEIALLLISKMSRPFKPKEFKDTYIQELRQIIHEKTEGKIPSLKGEAPEPTKIPDLMNMLKKSLNQRASS